MDILYSVMAEFQNKKIRIVPCHMILRIYNNLYSAEVFCPMQLTQCVVYKLIRQ